MESGKAVSTGTNGGESEKSLKDKGNEFFKAGNYLKAAALYTQAIKLDPSNATLYRYSQIAFTQCFAIHFGFRSNDFIRRSNCWVFDLT